MELHHQATAALIVALILRNLLSHEISRETLAMLALAGLATVVTETLRVEGGGTFTIDRLRITDAGRRAIGN
jgi:hypothetical protein